MSVDDKLVHRRGARPAGAAPIDVISVQSQVVYGHAGNSAAAEPLRQLGLRVAEVPTTLLSNAPVYPTTRGRVLPADWVADLLRGVDERGLPARAGMLLSGYLGTAAIGKALAEWIDEVLPRHPHLRYCLDPVLGDMHIGLYVEAGLVDIVRERLLPHAWLLTPNAFELGLLCGRECATGAECLEAARELQCGGTAWVVVHGIELGDGSVGVLAVGASEAYRLSTPKLPIDVTGTGDAFAALLAGFLLRGEPLPRALERATTGVHVALEQTLRDQVEELDVSLVAPAAEDDSNRRFVATRVVG